MKNREIRKNSFAEGTLLAYIAIVLTKILGALYSIPFYALIGDRGGFIYSCAYNIYTLFLEISTSGVPIALSIIIGEYIALGKAGSKERAYKIAIRFVMSVSFFAFIILQVFATRIAAFYIEDMTEGATVGEIAIAIRVISLSLLIVPFLSIERGYMQGHKFISVASNSQLIEQLVRILVVLAGAFVTLRILKLDLIYGIAFALFGATVGGLFAFFYVVRRKRFNSEKFEITASESSIETESDSTGKIINKLAKYCIVVIIISISSTLYNLIDMKLLLVGLHNIGFGDVDTQTISGISSTWIPKICNIITALTLGMTSSIAPNIADDFARCDYKGISAKVNQGIEMILFISVPLACGIILFSPQVYCFFYGQNAYGAAILRLAVVLNVISSLAVVLSMVMQSMKKGFTVCFALLVGIVLNLILDLPLIYLFNRIGWEPYLGATVASIIGETLTIALLIMSLEKSAEIPFSHSKRIAKKLIFPLLALIIAAFGFSLVWSPIEERSLLQAIQLAAYAAAGLAVYLLIASKTGILYGIFGESSIKKMIKKITRRD